MSTNAVIISKLDHQIKGISCHWDGDLDYVGAILYHYYQNPKKIKTLINLGDISKLGITLSPSPVMRRYGFDFKGNKKFNNLPKATKDKLDKQNLDPKYTAAYHRDRGEDVSHDKDFLTWTSYTDILKSIKNKHDDRIDPIFDEYVYFYNGKQWYLLYSDDFGYRLQLTLKSALKEIIQRRCHKSIQEVIDLKQIDASLRPCIHQLPHIRFATKNNLANFMTDKCQNIFNFAKNYYIDGLTISQALTNLYGDNIINNMKIPATLSYLSNQPEGFVTNPNKIPRSISLSTEKHRALRALQYTVGYADRLIKPTVKRVRQYKNILA